MSIGLSVSKRPTGITIIAGLNIFTALVALLVLILLGSHYTFSENPLLNEIYTMYFTIMIPVSLFVAYGLLKVRSWAWTVTIVLQIVSGVGNTVSLNIFALVMNLLIIYYLTRPSVKAFFKKTEEPVLDEKVNRIA